MHMRIMRILGLNWLVVMLVVAHALIARAPEDELEPGARTAARQVATAELARLRAHPAGALRADSLERPRVVYGIPLRLVTLTGEPGPSTAVRLRVLSASGEMLYDTATAIVTSQGELTECAS